jgi:hypothetical protein
MLNRHRRSCLLLVFLGLLLALPAYADSYSFVGTLANPTTPDVFTLTLTTTEDVTLQTYGFGGGTNAAGTLVSAGGTDPFVAIFSGTGDGATILTDMSSNPFGTSLDVSNYGSFMGCGPAGTPTIGGSATCGDITMNLTGLAAGTYTIVLSDGEYQASAIYDNGTLGEGFTDFTGTPSSQFCNIDINGVPCPANVTGNGAVALDVITSGTSSTSLVPEPSSVLLLTTGLVGLAGYRRRASRRA